MKSFIAILSLAVLAAASGSVGARGYPTTPIDASQSCGSNVVACCNNGSEQDSSGLVSNLLGPVLSNGCLGIDLNALNILNELTDVAGMCGNNEVKCCTGNKVSGVLAVDLSCSTL